MSGEGSDIRRRIRAQQDDIRSEQPEVAETIIQQRPTQKFQSNPTQSQQAVTLGSGMGTFGKALLVLFVGVPIGSFIAGPVGLTIGVLAFGYLCLKASWQGLVGEKDAARSGQCPHCDAPVLIRNTENAAMNCPTCKHRLTLRGDHLVDVTG